LNIISLFSGCGGLDLGFIKSGFDLVFANDNDKDVWETFEKNHNFKIDKRPVEEIPSEEMPDNVHGILGGPPCQSWSLAGAMRGIKDNRGKLFYEYIRILKDKKPYFFVAENVPGILSKTHFPEFEKILHELEYLGEVEKQYEITYKLVNAKNYGVPQERKRVIIVGYRADINKKFEFPKESQHIMTLKEAIGDLPESSPALNKKDAVNNTKIPNHEHMIGSFSSMYMSRNRKKEWNEPSFTIQAGGRHAPLHPKSKKMTKVHKDLWKFDSTDDTYRRLSVRECARIQTFPDDFVFYYNNVSKGYKMIGNAVPVKLSETIAKKIKSDLKECR